MPLGEVNVIEVLPSSVPGVRRVRLRSPGGHAVEAVDVPATRAQTLPVGGLFSQLGEQDGWWVIGRPLVRTLQELAPPPLAAAGLVQRILEALEVLHGEGGAHGALGLEGIGVNERDELEVRPCLHLPGELTPKGDVRAVASILLALCDPPRLRAAGLTRVDAFLSGASSTSRLGFGDARAARQAFAVVVRGLPVEDARASFLAAHGIALPKPAQRYLARPVAATPLPAQDRHSRVAEARAWLDRSVDEARSQRFGREAALQAESDRLAKELTAHTDAAIAASAALADRERRRLLQLVPDASRTLGFGGAMVQVEAPFLVDEAEEALDAASSEGMDVVGFLRHDDVVESGPDAARDGGDARAGATSGLLVTGSGDAARFAGADSGPSSSTLRNHSAGDERALALASARSALLDAETAAATAARERAEAAGEHDKLEALRSHEEAVRNEAAQAAYLVARMHTERREARDVEEARRAAEAARIAAEREAAELARAAAARKLAEAARAEAERRELERERARLQAEALEAERAEAERLEQARVLAEAEAAHVESERLEAARAEAEAQRLAERLEAERLEAERLEAERLEAERLEAERLEAERLEAERLEAERLEAERLEAERLEAERAEAARLAALSDAERAEAERVAIQRLEAERLEAERVEAERVAEAEAEAAAEAARAEAERVEAERVAAAEAEAATEAARLEAERLEAERLEAERLAAAEAARAEAARAEAARAEAARAEAARAEAARKEAERVAAPAAFESVSDPESGRSSGIATARAEAQRLAVSRQAHSPEHTREDPTTDTPDGDWPAHPSDFDDDHTRPGVARWEGLGGVTGNPNRMNEKGPGKWTLQGRSREELADQLPPGESRPMDLTSPAPAAGVPGWAWGAAGAAVLALAGWLAFS